MTSQTTPTPDKKGRMSMFHYQRPPGGLIGYILGLAIVAILSLAGAQSAYAKGPEPGVSCVGDSACRELARQCTGQFVRVVGTEADGTTTVRGWCQPQKHRKLWCVENWASGSCGELKKVCLAAKGTYTETTDEDGTWGSCTLPKPRAKEGQVVIGCSGRDDCNWLSGFCLAQAGTFESSTHKGGKVGGTCTYTPKPQ